MKLRAVAIIFLAILLCLQYSCTNSKPKMDIITGVWIDNESESTTIVIEKFGDNESIIKRSNYQGDKPEPFGSLIIEDGQFVIAKNKEPIIYNNEKDQLLISGQSYIRIENSGSEKYIGSYSCMDCLGDIVIKRDSSTYGLVVTFGGGATPIRPTVKISTRKLVYKKSKDQVANNSNSVSFTITHVKDNQDYLFEQIGQSTAILKMQ